MCIRDRIAVTVGYSLVARRVKALQAGAAFTFDYEATSTADSPALYTILQKTGSTKGTVSGLYAPDALQLSITAPGAVIPADPLTRVYVSGSETLYLSLIHIFLCRTLVPIMTAAYCFTGSIRVLYSPQSDPFHPLCPLDFQI